MTDSDLKLRAEEGVCADEDESIDLDAIFKKIGQFGAYQKWIYLLICLPMFCNGFYAFSYVFTTSRAVHRCFVPECDSGENASFAEPWLNFTTPTVDNSLSACTRFASLELERINSTSQSQDNFCRAENFDPNRQVECDRLVFRDDHVSIANEFGIFCGDEWKLSMVGSVNSMAQFVGIPLGGMISDRYGRKTIIALCGSISAVMGLLRSFAPNYSTFVVFEFLDAVAGNGLFSAVFLIAIELAGPGNRVLACSLLSTFYPIGEIALAYTAKYTYGWRTLLRCLYIPALLHLLYFAILPESVRWRLSKHQTKEVNSALRRAAKMNKSFISDDDLFHLHRNHNLQAQNDSGERIQVPPMSKVFKVYCWKIVTCSFCWFASALVYYGLSVYSVVLQGDKYNNFITLAVAEVFGYLLPYLIIDRYGRRRTLCASFLSGGFAIAATLFVGKDQHTFILVLFLLGKFAVTSAFQILLFYTSELFPTNVRHRMVSFCTMYARIGSMFAPQTILLAKYFPLAPPIIFSVASLTCGFLSLSFIETANTALPSTLEEAELKMAEKKTKKIGNIVAEYEKAQVFEPKK